VALFHSTLSRVDETTSFGTLFMWSASSTSLPWCGQNEANSW
jgi:hypothetical protein